MSTESKLIKTKLGLINLAEHLGNVSQACRIVSFPDNWATQKFPFQSISKNR